ncbi:MAG: alpha/beta fold hydrolase, partial [Pseudomonadota bacterium]
MRAPFRFIDFAILLLAATLVASALAALLRSERGLVVEPAILGGAPATVFRAADQDPAPAVLIAHGFAGSQQLMRSFAISLARAGFVAVTYDALGHGRNPEPLSGDVTKEEGATQALLAEMAAVSDAARALPGVDGRLALLGHSMASDIVVRRAQTDPGVEATVAVSMFSQTVDGASPRTLLILVGAWENFLAQEALRVVALAHGPDGVHDTRADPVEEAVTYGRFEDGSARRAALVDGAEHVGVLFAAEGQREAVAWLRAAFETGRDAPVEARGLTLVQLFAGLALLAWPLSRLLPTVAREPLGAGLPGARILLVAIPPAALTPLILWRAPIEILPVAVADYLAAHFLVYGALTALGLWLAGGLARPEPAP